MGCSGSGTARIGSVELNAVAVSFLKDSRTNLESPDIPDFRLFLPMFAEWMMMMVVVEVEERWSGDRTCELQRAGARPVRAPKPTY